MEELTHKLIQEIQTISKNIIDYQEYENNFKQYKYTENDFDEIEVKLKKQETYFEKLQESYLRSCLVVDSENEIKKLMEEFQKQIEKYSIECKNKKEEVGNKINDIIEEMKKNEKELKGNKYRKDYEESNYDEYLIETELYKKKRKEEAERKEQEMKRKEEEEEIQKRLPIVQGYLTREEMLMIEKEIGRYVDIKIFDTKRNKWSKGDCSLFNQNDEM